MLLFFPPNHGIMLTLSIYPPVSLLDWQWIPLAGTISYWLLSTSTTTREVISKWWINQCTYLQRCRTNSSQVLDQVFFLLFSPPPRIPTPKLQDMNWPIAVLQGGLWWLLGAAWHSEVFSDVWPLEGLHDFLSRRIRRGKLRNPKGGDLMRNDWHYHPALLPLLL